MDGTDEETDLDGAAELALEDIASNDTIMRVVGGLEGFAVAHHKAVVGGNHALGAAEDGGYQLFQRDDAAFDKDEVDADEIAVAQRVFVEREWTFVDFAHVFRVGLVIHLGHLGGDVAHGCQGVGDQVSGAVEVLEDKLVEILRLGGRVTFGVLHQGLGALGVGN